MQRRSFNDSSSSSSSSSSSYQPEDTSGEVKKYHESKAAQITSVIMEWKYLVAGIGCMLGLLIVYLLFGRTKYRIPASSQPAVTSLSASRQYRLV